MPSYSDGRDVGAVEAQPTTLTVNTTSDAATPPDGTLTLRQAIQVADGTLSAASVPATQVTAGDISPYLIEFALPAASTITLASPLPAFAGPVWVQGPGTGNLTILGQNQTYGQTVLTVNSAAAVSGLTLDGNGSHNSGIAVAAGDSLTLTDAVIQHTYASGNGGGILDTGGTVAVIRSQFLNDIAGAGAGIANVGGSLTVSQSTFDNCYAITSDGGGILNWAGSSGTGGGLTVVGCTFSNDVATNLGGGIALDAGSAATVVDSTFTNDQASDGGAIALHIGRYNPIYTVGLTLNGSTISGDTAFSGGGLYVEPNVGILTFSATVTDTIVAGNTGGDVNGALVPAGSNDLIGDGSGMTGLVNGVNADQIGTAMAPINPLLGPLADNGGPVKTMALLPGSPAIDHGGPAPAVDALTAADALGNPRVVAQSFVIPPAGGDGRDIGAYELAVQTTPTVLTVNSLSDAAPVPGDLTLRQAVSAADGMAPLSSLPAAQVSVGSPYFYDIQFSVTGTIALTAALPAVGGNGGVVLQGPGASALTIQGDRQPDAILTVAPGGALTVSGVTLDGGRNYNSGIAVGPAGSLAVTDAIIQNAYTSGNGGGIANVGGAVSVAGTRFLSDIAGAGAGIANLGGSLSVSQSTFDNCYAISTDGGGILNWAGPAAGGGGLTVTACTFSNDFATNLGGGIALDAGSRATVVDSTFANGQASDGGAISLQIARYNTVYSVGLALTASTVAGNTAFTGGGIYVEPNAGILTFTATLGNTIVAGNTGGDVSGALDPAGDHNLIGNGAGMTGLTDGANGNHVGTAATPIDPMLGPLQDNGGPTFTKALLPGSPAIDVGANPGNLATDQRGFPRVVGAGRRRRRIRGANAARGLIRRRQWRGGSAVNGHVRRRHVQYPGQLRGGAGRGV